MCDTTPTTPVTPVPENLFMHNGVIVEYIEGEAFINFDKATVTFITQHPPGKLAKNLYNMVLTLLQHQTDHKHPVCISDSLYDLRQLLHLLEHADNLLQTEQKDGRESDTYQNESTKFLEKATDFVYDHHPAQLSHTLCRIIIDLLQYDLPNGFPRYFIELLPDLLGLFKWLEEGIKLLKQEPTGGLGGGR